MSGVASGITKTFQAVGNAAARVGSAVAGVGTSLFATGAASGAGTMASGALSTAASSTGGVLGRVVTNAIKTAVPSALVGGAIGAMTGQGFGKGALMGGLGGAVVGGISGGFSNPTQTTAATGVTSSGIDPMTTGSVGNVPATTPTGLAPTGAAGQAPTTVKGNGFIDFLSSEKGAGLISGLGQGLMEYEKTKAQQEEYDKQRRFAQQNQDRVTSSYRVDPSVLFGTKRYEYDPAAGKVVYQ